MYAGRRGDLPARSVFLEGHDMRHLREVACGQGKWVGEQIVVTAVEFRRPPARTNRSSLFSSRMPRRT